MLECHCKCKVGAVMTALHFIRNLLMGPISYSVCRWQAFPA